MIKFGDFLEMLMSRRSVRQYTKAAVNYEDIENVLRAAMSAPSAGNQQPWHFVVIEERAILDEIPSFHPYAKMLKEASVGILVCGDLSLEKHKDFWIQDCAAATQNLLLAVHAIGLAAVWLGVYPRAERMAGFQKLLNLPDGIVPFAMIPIGHQKKPPQTINRFKAARVHRNKW
jgi:nitroreductase